MFPQSRKTRPAPSCPPPYSTHTLRGAGLLPKQRGPILPEPHIFGWSRLLGQEQLCQDGANLGKLFSHLKFIIKLTIFISTAFFIIVFIFNSSKYLNLLGNFYLLNCQVFGNRKTYFLSISYRAIRALLCN